MINKLHGTDLSRLIFLGILLAEVSLPLEPTRPPGVLEAIHSEALGMEGQPNKYIMS